MKLGGIGEKAERDDWQGIAHEQLFVGEKLLPAKHVRRIQKLFITLWDIGSFGKVGKIGIMSSKK